MGEPPTAENPRAESPRPDDAWARQLDAGRTPGAKWAGDRPQRSRRARQTAIHDQSRAACVESRTLMDGAAERVTSSGLACAVHQDQVAKSRASVEQSRALIRRLDQKQP